MIVRGLLLHGLALSLLAQEAPPPPEAPAPVPQAVTPAQPVPPPSNLPVRIRAVFTKQDESGKSEVLSAPMVTVPSGAEGRVQIQGKPDASGKPSESIDLTFSPTIGTDGVVNLAFHSLQNSKAPDPKADDKTDGKAAAGGDNKSERRRFKGGWNRDGAVSTVSREGLPVFHSFSPSDGLFSLEDSNGNRQWVTIGRTFDGWKLEAFNQSRQVLLISQGKFRQELPLYKAVVEATASEISTVVSLRSGETKHIAGVNGVDVAITVQVGP